MARTKKKRTAIDIIEDVQKRQINDGERITLYLSRSIYDKFSKLCGPISTSAAVQEWMKEAVELSEAKSKKAKKS